MCAPWVFRSINLLVGRFSGERAQIWIRAFLAIAAASLFSCSLLRGHMWKHTRKTGANTRKPSANTRKTSANPKYVTISILEETRVHETSAFFGERALFGSLGKNSCPEHFSFVTQIYVTMEGPGSSDPRLKVSF